MDAYESIQRLERLGIYCANQTDGIEEIINLPEHVLETLQVDELEDFMNRIAQHIIYLYQELNKAKAIEYAIGNEFKRKASPVVRKAPKEELSGRSSVEERWIYASLQTEELNQMFEKWQQSVIEVQLWENLPEAYTEKLNVFKKVHFSRGKEYGELT